MKISRVVFTLLIVVFSLSSAFALTASMGNVRMVLYPDVYPGETTVIDKSIKVNNVNDQEILITLSTEGNFSDLVRIIDTNFTLGINESRDARFQLVLDKPGRYDGKIFVAFNPYGNTVNASPVGLASNIIIFAKNSTRPVGNETMVDDDKGNAPSWMLLAAVAIIAVGVGVYVMRGRK